MTDDERIRLDEAKAEVSEWLQDVRTSDYRLSAVDPRISAYVREVAQNPAAHNLFEQLAVRKFLRMCSKYGLAAGPVRRFFALYERLKFPGKSGDRSYDLTPVQAFQFASIFGFWSGGRRVVREACLFVPRKFSKTTGTASLAVYDLLFGESNAEAYVAANSSDQAKKCFDVIRGCMRHLDPHGRRYTVNKERIESLRPDRSAIAQCLTASARTKDGLNASTVIMDEFSQARDNALLTVLTTSMGVRDNPLTVIITTASDVFDGPFYAKLQGYKRELLGDCEPDDSLFAHLFEPDAGDREDDPATWRKVHPHLGVTVNADFYEQEYRKALRDGGEAMLAFRTKLLNVYAVNDRASWISAATAREAMRQIDLASLSGKPNGVAAIDLSESDDFSAVTVAWHERKRGERIFHTAYFFPEGALPGHPNERLYRKWVAEGWLRLTRGPVIDYAAIVDYILEAAKYVNIVQVGYDPYKSKETVNKLGNSRPGAWKIINPVRQTPGHFNAAVEAFEHGIKKGRIFINDNPINAYCFGNAVLMYDNNENAKPEKRTQYQKIDGVITKLMCMRQMIDHEWGASSVPPTEAKGRKD